MSLTKWNYDMIMKYARPCRNWQKRKRWDKEFGKNFTCLDILLNLDVGDKSASIQTLRMITAKYYKFNENEILKNVTSSKYFFGNMHIPRTDKIFNNFVNYRSIRNMYYSTSDDNSRTKHFNYTGRVFREILYFSLKEGLLNG